MSGDKKRIGLLLASIHTGISLNVWDSFARTALDENVSLFIFPGGRLNASQDFENLRNHVYYLVNSENLDGCISWSSTIQYKQTKEEFEQFHKILDPLPYITLGFKAPDHPCVEFDAYNGMKSLIKHCIEVHGARKIAFLRGPDYHQSAQARFKGYCDAVKEAGMDLSSLSALITEPFNWSAGDGAAAQLFDGQSLIPGRDFDTLAGASDMMVMRAAQYFSGRGYHIPADYHAVGFNNSVESRIIESPLSTVHLPYTEMSKESFSILNGILGRKKHKQETDVFLNTEILLRESCGCFHKKYSGETSKHIADFKNSEEYLVKMIRDCLKLDTTAVNSYVLPLIQELVNQEPDRNISKYFFTLFEKAITAYFNSGKEYEYLLQLIGDLFPEAMILPAGMKNLESTLYQKIFNIREQLTIHERYEKERHNSVLNSLKCDLLGTRDRSSLVQSLASHLPGIGINTAAIILYGDEKNSVFVGGFSHEGVCPVKEQRFPAGLLVPASLRSNFDNGIFMVQPLFIENQSLGYFIHNVSINDGVICEELRSSVSYALKGIFLLEETLRAKKIAEQAERSKTELLQALENGLFDPLQGINDRLENLECMDLPIELHEELKDLKLFIKFKEAEAGNFMEFTLARLDELALNVSIFDMAELLPDIGTFPLLAGDTARLAQCFSLIREQYTDDYYAELTYSGLSVTFREKETDKKLQQKKTHKEEKTRQFSLLLAERIILMHSGNFSLYRDHCTITLPWTTLTGQDIIKTNVSSQNNVLLISDSSFLPANFFTLPQITDMDEALPGKTAFIAWNASGAGPEDMVKVMGLKNKAELSGIPFLCYGMPSGGSGIIGSAASIADAVNFALKSPKKGSVLFIGSHDYWGDNLNRFLSPNEIHLDKIRIDSMSSFNQTVSEIRPLLIIFSSLDKAGAKIVRDHPLTVMVPVILIGEQINNTPDVNELCQYSRLIICHRSAITSPEFQTRIQSIIGGDEILPPHTGILVKKAILFFGQHAESHISRWKLADAVNVSEDYLTRIFHREMGLSLWDYLNRLRIFRAAELLRKTDETIQNIALKTGFQGQAYFCRVFKKIYGVAPGQLRK